MCGIVGYIGNEPLISFLLNGLSKLEYRGYDSAGIAAHKGDSIKIYKAQGKLDNLKADLKDNIEDETSDIVKQTYNRTMAHYKDADEKHDRSKNPECSKIVQRIGKYSSEHEAAVAHDAFVLWYGLSNRLNYKQFKRPVSLEELNLILKPKEETCGKLTRPDCYKCKWHLEIPEKPIIRCRNQFAEIHPYRVALEHGWWNFPFIDPLWLESCDSFMPTIGASSVIIDNGESMEVIVKENKSDILTKKEKISGESLRKEEQGAAQKEFKGD